MIESKDISIVVQGPILSQSKFGITQKTTQVICERLKKLFPESELILSTWEGESAAGIPYDLALFNSDPGASWFDYYNHDNLNNCNRLIISTLAGVKAATRKYVLKVRSDLYLVNKKFLKYFSLYPAYNEEYKFVKSRIISFSMWSIQGHKTPVFTMHKPFHISDWAYFGYKEDLINLYDVPLIEEPKFSQWFLDKFKPFHDVAPHVLWKMPPEQHITSSFFKKFTHIDFEHTADTDNKNIERSSKLIMNNFLVLDQTQFFFISLKHICFQFSQENHEWFIHYGTWLNDYYKFILNHTFLVKVKLKLYLLIRVSSIFTFYKFLKLIDKKKHVRRLTAYLIKQFI